jgi:uncharacterized protein YqjF (DUF2071 family)
MTWRQLLFMHWPIEPERLRPLVPGPLRLETRDGQAWLGITPFRMTRVRPRALPPVPTVRDFLELNVRTYVTYQGKPGVFFFSLDAASRLAVETARATFGLPYFAASMDCRTAGDGWVHYESRRRDSRGPAAELAMRYRPVGDPAPAEPGSLEAFLTERYCLYTVDGAGRPWRGEIHHPPWPLQPAETDTQRRAMTRLLGLALADGPPHVRYAERLDVVAWPGVPVSPERA